MMFWLASGLILALVAALLLPALRRGDASAISGAQSDVAVYRDQLADIDRDLARGVLAPEDADAVRLEVSRRLLAADKRASGEAASGAGRGGWIASFVVLAALGASVAVYARVGAPGYSDQPLDRRLALADETRAARPDQASAESAAAALRLPVEAEPEFAQLMEKLRDAVARRPGDVQGLALLARNEARLGNFAAARRAQEQLVEAKGNAATPADLSALLDITVYAAGGIVTPEADRLISRLLETQPGNGTANYYLGLSAAQVGRADLAFPIWRRLWEESPDGAPWLDVLREELPRVARAAGVNYELAPRRGPTAADIAAASEMTAEDRAEMIRGMVEGLSARLASDGGPPEDWARLISAVGVLGEIERAVAIAEEAETVFAGDENALAAIARARASLDR